MSTSNRWIAAGLVALLTMMTLPAMAAPTTWTSATLGYWTNSGSWSAGVPGAGDDAIFTGGANGQAIIDGDVTINSLDVNGYTGKIVFTNGSPGNLTIASNLFLGAGSTIVPQYSSIAGNGAGRIITVGSNATINGTINGSGQGFANGAGPGFSGNSSSHGGYGGNSGPIYGSLTEPTSLGGGGRVTGVGNVGGGALKLDVAGTLTVNGRISMDGTGNSHGGSAGGSVWLIANTLDGSGTISADAPSLTVLDGNTRGGGGGRVAIEYTNSTFSGAVSVAGGQSPLGLTVYGQPGTLWAPAGFLAPAGTPASPQTVTITNSFQFYPDDTNSTYYWNLTVNGGWVEFHSNALYLSDLLVTGKGNLRFDRLRSGTNDILALAITNSLTLAAGTNWLFLPTEGSYNLPGGLSVGTDANLYLFPNTSTVNGVGVTITAQTAAVNGTVSGRGFPQGKGPGFSANSGSHGGYSGDAGAVYGSLTQPTSVGSGGRITGPNYGGGALKLDVAGALTVNGRIGMDGAGDGFAGSAGGSVWLIAGALAGSGTISANAGIMTSADGNNRGGGGGRVAIEYTNSTFSGSVSVAGGNSVISLSYYGQPGTLWAPKNFLWASGTPESPQAVTITNSFQFYPSDDTNAVYYWDLTLNRGWVEFHSNTLYLSNLLLTNSANLRFDRQLSGLKDVHGLTISNAVTLTAGTNYLYLPAEGVYDLSGDLFVGTNAVLYAFGNTGIVNAAAGGLTNKPYGIGVTITAQTATVNGSILGRGFPAGTGPTFVNTASGHGGLSGSASQPYGSLTRPTELAGGGRTTSTANRGGGAIKLVTRDALTLNGIINMNPTADIHAGNAGGSIWLIANALAGNGQILASAPNATGTDSNARGGGGGRVAIEYANSTFGGTVSVAGGTDGNGEAQYGKTGTLFRCQSPYPLADSDGADGLSLATALSVSSNTNGMLVTRTIDKWRVTPNGHALSWVDSSTDWASNTIPNVATYTLSGAAPGAKLMVYTNSILALASNYGLSGAASFTASLAPSCPVFVQGGTPGSVFMVH